MLSQNPVYPWLVKHSALYYKVWNDFNPLWVKVRRCTQAVQESGRRSGLNPGGFVEKYIEAMNQVEGFEVWPERFVEGDFSALYPIFDEMKIEFCEQIANALVDKNHWHYRGDSYADN